MSWLRCLRNGHSEWFYVRLMDVSVCLSCGKLRDGEIANRQEGEVLGGYKLKLEHIRERRPRRIVDRRSGRVSYRLPRFGQRLRAFGRTGRRGGDVAGD